MQVNRSAGRALTGLALLGASCAVWAQAAPAGLPLMVAQSGGGTSYSVPIQTLLFFTALSFLPALLLMMTGFTRIVIVMSLLRHALGTQTSPPNQVIIGMQADRRSKEIDDRNCLSQGHMSQAAFTFRTIHRFDRLRPAMTVT